MSPGVYVAGALVAVALADTKAAPVVAAFLLAAAIYNANHLMNRPKGGAAPATPSSAGRSGFLPDTGFSAGGSGGGGGGSW